MPRGLRRFQESGQSHLDPSASRDFGSGQTPARRLNFQLLVSSALFRNGRGVRSVCSLLEDMRRRFELCVYGYVVMPEHVHLLLSEPPRTKLAEAIH